MRWRDLFCSRYMKAFEYQVPTYEELYSSVYGLTVSCGHEAIDKRCFVQRGKITMLFSRMREIRTAFAQNIAARILIDECQGSQAGVLAFSGHCSGERYLFSMAAMLAGVHIWRYERGLVLKEIREAEADRHAEFVKKLQASRLRIEDGASIDPDQMVMFARAANRDGRIGLVIVDQLQDFDCGGARNASAGWGVVGSRLHQMATELDAPVLVLSGHPLGAWGGMDTYAGYGCLFDYIDHVLSLTPIAPASEDYKRELLLKEISAPNDTGVRVVMDVATYQLVGCCPMKRSEPPPGMPLAEDCLSPRDQSQAEK